MLYFCNQQQPVYMNLRRGNISDIDTLKSLYAGTIRNVCCADYDEQQIGVWSANEKDDSRWNKVAREQTVIVAEDGNEITGFCTLTNRGYIDLFFVHMNHQRKGIARVLYRELEKFAAEQGVLLLTADVSKTARPFFESMGFDLIAEQEISLKDVVLVNYRMSKVLDLK